MTNLTLLNGGARSGHDKEDEELNALHNDELIHMPSNGHAVSFHLEEAGREDLNNDTRGAMRPAVADGGEAYMEWKQEVEVAYRVEESPVFGLCILLGFQV